MSSWLSLERGRVGTGRVASESVTVATPAPNQQVCWLGSREEARGVRVRVPPGQSFAPSLDDDRELVVGHGFSACHLS